VELVSQDEIDAAVQKEDEAACANLEGVLKTHCIEDRQKARAAPKFWSEDEVRQGLWKTEKALADLQVRQYKHSKEVAEAHDEHTDKFATFKERMEGALDLIHKIQVNFFFTSWVPTADLGLRRKVWRFGRLGSIPLALIHSTLSASVVRHSSLTFLEPRAPLLKKALSSSAPTGVDRPILQLTR
jgi:hypothetical protein